MTATDKPARRTVSAEEKAQDRLDTVCRQLDRARVRRDKAKTEYDAAQEDVIALEGRRDYVAQDPALPPVQKADTYVGPPVSEPTTTLPTS